MLRNLRMGIKSLFQKARRNREMDEELQGYVEAAAADNMSRGMTREQALRTARVEMGSMESVKHGVWSAGMGIDGELNLDGPALRRASACQDSRVHHRLRTYAGARHWSQHGGFQCDECRPPALAAGCRSATRGLSQHFESAASHRYRR